MALVIQGKITKMGNDVNTDVIIPGKYLDYTELSDLEKYAFEPLGEDFRKELKTSEIIVAGRNFGCGSAREQGATAIKAMGIKAVVARSFARTFFRNAINSGLFVVEQPDIYESVESGEELLIDLDKSIMTSRGKDFKFPPLPEGVSQILRYGGLFEYMKKQVESGEI